MIILKHIEQHMGKLLVLCAVLGYFVPQIFHPLTPYIQECLMLALFLGCLKMDFEEALHLKQNALKCVIYSLFYLLGLPLLFYVLTPFLEPNLRLGLFLLLGVSSAFSNPLFSSFLRLKILWTAAFSTLTSIIMPFTLPYIVESLFGISLEISPAEMMVFLSKMVFIPIFASIAFKRFLPRLTQKTISVSGPSGILILSLFVGAIVSQNHAFLHEHLLKLETIPILIWLFVAFLYGFVVGFILPASSREERWTNSLMFGNMNNGIIILLAASFFPPEVLFVTLLSEVPWTLAQPIFQWAYRKDMNLLS